LANLFFGKGFLIADAKERATAIILEIQEDTGCSGSGCIHVWGPSEWLGGLWPLRLSNFFD